MLKVFAGPMWSSKTTTLARRIDEVERLYDQVLIFKSARDTRDPKDQLDPRLRSRKVDFQVCAMLPDEELPELKRYARPHFLTVIDEAMLIQENLIDLVDHFIEVGEGDLWLSGLDLTSEGEPFNEFYHCIWRAHEVVHLRARCNTPDCNYPASRTFQAAQKTEAILVGDAGYSPHCLRCWSRLMTEKKAADVKKLIL